MPEKIGLVAELDLRAFNRNVTTYLSKINQMQTATQNMARAVSSSFSALGNQSQSSLGRVVNSLSQITTQARSMKTQLASINSIGNLSRQLSGLTTAANRAAAALSRVNAVGGTVNQINLGPMGGLAGGLGAGLGSVLGGVGGIGRSISSLVGNITRPISSVIGSITGLMGSVVRSLSGMATSIFRIVGSIATTIGIAFNAILRTVLNIVGNLVSGVINAFSSILRTIGSIVGSIVSTVARAFTSLLSTVMGIVQSLIGGIVNAFGSLVGMVANAVSGVASAVMNAFSGILSGVTSIIGSLARSVLNVFTSIARSVIGIVENMARAILSTIGNMVKKVGDMLRGMATNILDAYRDLGSEIVKIVTVATAAVTGALILAGRAAMDWFSGAIAGASEFEQHMADIQAVLRKTRDEVAPLGDLIDTLALDPQLVVGTEDAAAVVEQLARNGIEMTDILEGAAEAAILLANASGGEFAEAADVATMAMQMFGLAASEVNRIADVSQGVINNSRIELEDWVLALGNGGAAAAAIGVTFEDFATVIAGTVNLFHSARQAGTGAMNFFQRLVPITEVAADEMREVGLYTGLSQEEFEKIGEEIEATQKRIAELDPRMVHYDELIQAHTDHLKELQEQLVPGQNAFFDEGQFIGTIPMIEKLREAVKDLSQEELVEFGRRTFGNDALETFIGLVQMGEEEFQALKDELTITNAAMDAAIVRTQTLQARWRNLGDIWEAIRRKSGEKFIDMLLNMVNRLTVLTNNNQDRIIDFFGRMAELMNRLVDAAIPWVEAQLPAIIDNLEAFAHWLVETVLNGERAQYWFDRMSPGLRNFMERIFATVRAVREFAGQILDLVGSLSKTFRPFIEFMLQNVELKDVLIAAAGAVLFRFVPGMLRLVAVAGLAVKAVSMIRKGWENDWGGIRSFFEKVWPKIRGPLVDFINNLLTGKWQNAWKDAVDVVGTVLSELEDVVPDFFKNFVNLAHDIIRGDWRGAWENVVEIAHKSFDLVKRLLRDLEMPFTDFIVNVLEGSWARVWQQIRNAAGGAFDWIKEQVGSLDTPFTDFILDILEGRWYQAWRTARGVVVNAFDTIVEYLDNLDYPITEFIADVIRGRWFEAWEDFKIIFQQVRDAILFILDEINLPFTNFIAKVIRGDWEGAWANVANVARTAFELVKKILSDFNQPWSDFLLDVLEGRWGEVWGSVRTIAVNILEELKNYLPGWGDNFVGAIQAVLEGRWVDAWNLAKQGVIDALGELKNLTPDWFDPFLTSIQRLIEGDWKGAWQSAVTGVNGVLATLATFLPEWAQPFVGAVQALLEGDFARAWDNARHGVNLTLDKIKENVPTWMGNAITLLQQVLAGEWSAAWETAKTMALDALQPIRDWVDEQGKIVYDWFKTNMPESTAAAETGFKNVKTAWDEFVEVITSSETQGNIDHLASVVIAGVTTFLEGLLEAATAAVLFLQGDWVAGWKKAGEAATTFSELPALNAISTWFGTTFPDAAAAFNNNIPAIETAWDPVGEKWKIAWAGISNWWNTDVKAFFAKTLTSVSDYASTTIAQFGLLAQAVLEIFSGEGSITDRISRALEITKGITELEMQFWQRDLERSSLDFKDAAKTVGSAFNTGLSEGINEGMAGTDDGRPAPEGLVYWLTGIQGPMTKYQDTIYENSKKIGVSLNSGFVTGIEDPAKPAVNAIHTWSEEMMDEAQNNLQIQSPSGRFKDLAKYTMEGFRDGVLQNMHLTFEAAGQMTVQFVEKFQYIIAYVPPIAREMLIEFVRLFDIGMDAALGRVSVFAEQVAMRMQSLAQVGQNAGSQLGVGLADGLNSQLGAVQAAAASLATAAQTGVEVQAQIQSPSKVFRKLGEYMREGLVLGFKGNDTWQNSLFQAGMAANKLGESMANFGSSVNTSSYSYNTYSSPVQIGPIYVSDRMDMAEFEHRVENLVTRLNNRD